MLGSQNRFVLITEASSGIGYELARLFAEEGKKLVLVARNMTKLEDVRQEFEEKYRTNVMVIPKDLSKSEAPREIFSKLENEGVNINDSLD